MPIHDWTKVDSGVFHYLHLRWIGTICDALNDGRLTKDYYAIGEQRSGGLQFEPDVLALHRSQGKESTPTTKSGGSIGLLTAPPKATVFAESEIDAYRRKQNRIAVRHSSDDDIVAVLEIVSAGNKSSRKAIRDFVDKAEAFMDRDIHFMFVDLYPLSKLNSRGLHGLIWEEMTGQEYVPAPDKPLCAASYEANGSLRAFVEPLAVADTMPDMPLFMKPEAYVSIPLEATYQAAVAALPSRFRDTLSMGK